MTKKEILKLEKEWKDLKRNYDWKMNDIESSGFEVKDGEVVRHKSKNFWIELSINGFTSTNRSVAARYFIPMNHPKFVEMIRNIEHFDTYEEIEETFEELSDILLLNKENTKEDEVLYEEYLKTFKHLLDVVNAEKVEGQYMNTPNGTNDFCFDRYFTISEKCYGYLTLIKNVSEDLSIYNFEEIF